ncbi:MAG: potassium transporter Kup [Gammaproteobacteria bacterium]
MQDRTGKTLDRRLAVLCLAALGVVYGDIGTSPLYTVKEVFSEHGGVELTETNVLGTVSTIFWALIVVVTLKYVILMLRADNRGEGGIMALLAMAVSALRHGSAWRKGLLALGTFGATLFLGDCIITPAISVLSAVEGLELLTPALHSYVLPVACTVLFVLFAVQKHGTAIVGRWFGPIILVWFAVLGFAGLVQIVQTPRILWALDPLNAVSFLVQRGPAVFLALGAIVLALTGAEALYADMGHFGRRAIRISWLAVVLPGLALNYMGQGALLLAHPEAVANPFYFLFAGKLLLPAVLLATLATIIASQAVISGAYSIVQQAVHLGMLPRMRVIHTSSSQAGQIYVPAVNWLLLSAVLAVTISFGSSSALAAAYGIAVTGTMLITTLLTFVIVRRKWRYPLWLGVAATGFFFTIDLLLLGSTSLKFLHGGWFPVVLGLGMFTVMWTWKEGRAALAEYVGKDDPALTDFIATLQYSPFPRAARTAVYLVANPAPVPRALLHNLKHNLTLHEKNLVVTVDFAEVPFLECERRVGVGALGHDFWRVCLHFGFMETPDVPAALEKHLPPDLGFKPFTASFFISRETIVATHGTGMTRWREELFGVLTRNAGSVVNYFNLPPNQVIELGSRIHI